MKEHFTSILGIFYENNLNQAKNFSYVFNSLLQV